MPHRDFSSLVEARAFTYGEAKGMRSTLALLRAEQTFLTAVHAHPAWAAILSNIVGKAKGLEAAAGRMRCHCGQPQHELCRCPAVEAGVPVAVGKSSYATGVAGGISGFATGATKGNACFSKGPTKSKASCATAATRVTVSMATGATLIRSPSLASISSSGSSSTTGTHEQSDSVSVLSDDPPPGPNGLSIKPVKDTKGKSRGKDGKGKSKKGKSGKDSKSGKSGKDCETTIVLGLEHGIPLDVPIPRPNETVTVLGPGHGIQNADVSVSTGVSSALGGSMGAVGPSIAFKLGSNDEVVSVLGQNAPQFRLDSVTPKPHNHHATFGVPSYAAGHGAGSIGFMRPRTNSMMSSVSADLQDLEPYIRVATKVVPRHATVASMSSVMSSPVAPKYPDIHPIMPDLTGAPVFSVPPTPTNAGLLPTLQSALGLPSPSHGTGSSSSSSDSSSSSSSSSSKTEEHKLTSHTSAAKPALPGVLGLATMVLPGESKVSAATQASGSVGKLTNILAQGVSAIQKYTGDDTQNEAAEVVQGCGNYGPDYKPPGVPGSYVHPGYGMHPSPSSKPAAPFPQPVTATPGVPTALPHAPTAMPSLPVPATSTHPAVPHAPAADHTHSSALGHPHAEGHNHTMALPSTGHIHEGHVHASTLPPPAHAEGHIHATAPRPTGHIHAEGHAEAHAHAHAMALPPTGHIHEGHVHASTLPPPTHAYAEGHVHASTIPPHAHGLHAEGNVHASTLRPHAHAHHSEGHVHTEGHVHATTLTPTCRIHAEREPPPDHVLISSGYSPHCVPRPPMDAPTLGNSQFAQVTDWNLYSESLAHPLPLSGTSSGASTVDDEPLDDVLERLSFEEQQYIASLFSGNEDPNRVHHPALSDQAVYVIASMSDGRFRQSVKPATENVGACEDAEEKGPKENKKDKKKRKTNTNRKPKRVATFHEAPVVQVTPTAAAPCPPPAAAHCIPPTEAHCIPPAPHLKCDSPPVEHVYPPNLPTLLPLAP
ncbi:hypothetical protein CspHIS471_0508220 [Cutaneotrichosporon sp. HIS471]|nr:hypothetical protein CspHIS471_0508220 [Cutaneotrichosporon sp. HIS471]